jgi:hypothetical protein
VFHIHGKRQGYFAEEWKMSKRGILSSAVIFSAAVAANAAIYQSGPIAPSTVATYTDAQGDQVGSTNKDRDIWSVTITNDATNLYFTINLNPGADLSAGGSFDYGIGITTGSPTAGGDTSANATTHGNAYDRTISIDSSLGGMTDWIGIFGALGTGGTGTAGSSTNPYVSYGFNDYVWNGTTWGTQVDKVASGEPIAPQAGGTTNSTMTVTVPMADFSNLTLTTGSSFLFDVYSTGTSSGQTAYDSLADQTATNGTNSSTTQYNGTVLDSYTIVPEPASACIMTLSSLALLASRKRRAQ